MNKIHKGNECPIDFFLNRHPVRSLKKLVPPLKEVTGMYFVAHILRPRFSGFRIAQQAQDDIICIPVSFCFKAIMVRLRSP